MSKAAAGVAAGRHHDVEPTVAVHVGQRDPGRPSGGEVARRRSERQRLRGGSPGPHGAPPAAPPAPDRATAPSVGKVSHCPPAPPSAAVGEGGRRRGCSRRADPNVPFCCRRLPDTDHRDKVDRAASSNHTTNRPSIPACAALTQLSGGSGPAAGRDHTSAAADARHPAGRDHAARRAFAHYHG